MKMYFYCDVKHNVYTVLESFLSTNTPKPIRQVSKKSYFSLPQRMFLLVLKGIFKSNPYLEYDHSDEFNLNISNVYEYVILRQ